MQPNQFTVYEVTKFTRWSMKPKALFAIIMTIIFLGVIVVTILGTTANIPPAVERFIHRADRLFIWVIFGMVLLFFKMSNNFSKRVLDITSGAITVSTNKQGMIAIISRSDILEIKISEDSIGRTPTGLVTIVTPGTQYAYRLDKITSMIPIVQLLTQYKYPIQQSV